MADPARKNPYQAVTVVPGLTDCEAVRALQDQQFLASEAPLLPLKDCTSSSDCDCKYEKTADRRQDERRMIDLGISNQFYSADEKRGERRGRRNTD